MIFSQQKLIHRNSKVLCSLRLPVDQRQIKDLWDDPVSARLLSHKLMKINEEMYLNDTDTEARNWVRQLQPYIYHLTPLFCISVWLMASFETLTTARKLNIYTNLQGDEGSTDMHTLLVWGFLSPSSYSV